MNKRAAWRWRVTLPDREFLSFNIPLATREDILRIYPDARHVEPDEDYELVRVWLLNARRKLEKAA